MLAGTSLSSLPVFIWEKTTSQFSIISENLQQNHQQTIFLVYSGHLGVN